MQDGKTHRAMAHLVAPGEGDSFWLATDLYTIKAGL
jgi:hypothetical protein